MQLRRDQPLSGRELRYVLTVTLLDAGGPLAVAELDEAVRAAGMTIVGRASKTISDALRWEVRKGRVVRVGRSTYARGTMPRSTEWWIRTQVR